LIQKGVECRVATQARDSARSLHNKDHHRAPYLRT
jgi:hypothetical protein